MPARRLSNRRGSTAVAVLLLSLGVGASTAAFSLVNRVMPHTAPFTTCETTIEYASEPFTIPTVSTSALDVPAAGEMQERLADAYEMSFDAAGDAVGSWSDVAGELAESGLAIVTAAGALALLVACTRRAAPLLDASRAPMIAAGAALGALPVAALLASVLGLPSLGVRTIAFAIAVSMVAAHFARAAHRAQVLATG